MKSFGVRIWWKSANDIGLLELPTIELQKVYWMTIFGRKNAYKETNSYMWDDSYILKVSAGGLIHKCIAGKKLKTLYGTAIAQLIKAIIVAKECNKDTSK